MFDRSTIRALACLPLVIATARCSYDAWLGMQCADPGVPCAAAPDAGAAIASSPGELVDASAATVKGDSGGLDAQMPATSDAAPPDAAVSAASTCRSVAMTFFACATGAEAPGIPRLHGGGAYTLRFQGAYAVDTTFQVQGSTSACSLRMFGNVTLLAGEPAVERCLTPFEDVALLVTVVSGDVQVWMENGIQAEICDGCE